MTAAVRTHFIEFMHARNKQQATINHKHRTRYDIIEMTDKRTTKTRRRVDRQRAPQDRAEVGNSTAELGSAEPWKQVPIHRFRQSKKVRKA